MWHLSIKVHPHRHGLGVLQNGWRNPERKIPHRNATGDQQKHNLNWLIQTQTDQLWKQIMLHLKKVFNIRSIYQDSFLHLFNTLTILQMQKLSGPTTSYFWGGNEQTDWHRLHSLLKSLLQNTTLKRPARCQQQCIDHQEPQGSATVWLPVGRSMRVWIAFFVQLVWQSLHTPVNWEVFHHCFRVGIRKLCETTN